MARKKHVYVECWSCGNHDIKKLQKIIINVNGKKERWWKCEECGYSFRL